MVEVCKTKKLLDLLDTCWHGAGLDCSQLVQINTNHTIQQLDQDTLHYVFQTFHILDARHETFHNVTAAALLAGHAGAIVQSH